jgi:hypothetical protein
MGVEFRSRIVESRFGAALGLSGVRIEASIPVANLGLLAIVTPPTQRIDTSSDRS